MLTLHNGRGKTLFTVQALRAFAASSVVVHHVMIVAVQKAGYQYSFPSTAAAGVDLFFLISGFIMVYTHFDDFGKAGASASFIRRRLIQSFRCIGLPRRSQSRS